MLDVLDRLPALLIVVLGALVSELSGTLNIAIEGLMLLGSFLAVLSLQGSLGTIPGIILAVGVGFFLGLFLGVLNGKLGANIFIAGLGMNLAAVSVTAILGQLFFQSKGVIQLDQSSIGPWIFWAQLISTLVVFLFITVSFSWSLMGLRFRSLANHADMLHARGVNIDGYRMWALGISGALAALGGAFSSLSLGAYVPNGTSGKGWIALVLVYAGGKHPWGILLVSIAYLFMDQLATELQTSLENPGIIVGLPYLGVLLILVLVQMLTRKRFEL